MPRRRESAPLPKHFDQSRLCAEDHVRWYVSTNPAWEYLTDVQLGEELGLSAGYVGMIRSGARPPTKAFLEAIGWEAVTLYRMKLPAVSSQDGAHD